MDSVGPTEEWKRSPAGQRAMARLIGYILWPVMIVACIAVGVWWSWWLCWIPLVIGFIGGSIYSYSAAKRVGYRP